MKLFALTNIFYNIGLKKEAKELFKLANIHNFNITDVYESDLNTFPIDPDSTIDFKRLITDDTFNEGSEQNEPLGDKWAEILIGENHKIIEVIYNFYNLVWSYLKFKKPTMISISDIEKASKVFRYFGMKDDGTISDKMDRPNWIIEQGRSIVPEHVLNILSLSLSEFFKRLPSGSYNYSFFKELQDWSYSLYENYADYYYDKVSPDKRNQFISNISKENDERNPLSEDEEKALIEKIDSAQKRWESENGFNWSDQTQVL